MINASEQADLLEAIAAQAYDGCHADDSFEDMRHRARFSKEDRYLRNDWLAFARRQLEGASAEQAG